MADLATDVTPGLVCAHHHLYSALARGMPAPPTDPDDLPRDPRAGLVAARQRARPARCSRGRRSSVALEALESGTTTIIDHHESPERHRGLALGHRRRPAPRSACGSSAPTGSPTATGPDGARRGLEENRRFLADGRPWASSGSTPRSPARTRPSRRRPSSRESFGVGVHVHVCEGPEDAEAPARLARLTAADWLLAHGVHLPTGHDLAGTILHNPFSNLNNAVGYAAPGPLQPTRWRWAPTASAPRCSRPSAWPTPCSARST